MSPRMKRILNYLFIILTLILVVLLGSQGQDLPSAFKALGEMQPRWLFLCFAAMFCFYATDAVSLWFFLRQQGYHIRLRDALYIGIIGSYYSNITPGASGGQPMQIYNLKKKHVPIGIGTSALLVKFFCFQFSLAIVGAVLWIRYSAFIDQQLGGNRWILIAGFVYNAVMVSALVTLVLNKRVIAFLMRLIIRLCTKLRIIRDPEATELKWMSTLDTFHSSILMLGKNPLPLLVQLGLGAAQLLSQMLVVWFIYRGFHLAGHSCMEIVALAVMLYTSAAYTPLPGASGAQEGVFMLYFGQIFPSGYLFIALLIWRFFTYYLSLLTGASTTIVHTIRKSRREIRREREHAGNHTLQGGKVE